MKAVICCILSVVAAAILCVGDVEANKEQLIENFGKIPLSFTLNQGQTDSLVKFTTAGNGCSMFFAPFGTTFLLSRETAQSAAKKAAGTSEDMMSARNTEREYESFAVKTVFVGANKNPEVVGEDRLAWNNNYFIGSDPAKWRTDVPNYGKIRLKEVYSGIDLVYYGNKNRIKYDFVVKPGEDHSKVVLQYDLGANGGNALSINGNGELVVKTPLGDIIERKPYCYQKIDGKEIEVSIGYRIIDASLNSFGFEIGAFNTGSDLYIDPELLCSTFLGGSSGEIGDNFRTGLAVDSSGNTYITGTTYSSNYPVTSGSIDGNLGGSVDGFVSKLNSSGTALVYSTYIGGSNDDYLNAIAVDSNGKAYVTGWSISSDFPTTNGAFDQSDNGGRDGFIVKLTTSGDAFVYSTYIGGNSLDACLDICVDNAGNAYVVGDSNSSDYPTTTGAYDRIHNGGNDVIISKLNPTGTALVYSTYIGGSGDDSAYFMTLDSGGNVYYSRVSISPNYPTTPNAIDAIHNGNYDAVLGKLDVSGGTLLYSSYVGGSRGDWGAAIAVGTTGIITMTGSTESKNFPTTFDAFDMVYIW